MSARELAAATTASRNRYVDLLRAASIAVVVLGHWLIAIIGWEDGAFVSANLLEKERGLQLLTWVFQVMLVFFIVGGFSNAASWESALRRGLGYPDWLRARFARLLRPTVVFVAVWTAGALLAVAVGVDPEVIRVGSVVVSLPLWFLAVYALVVAAAPAMLVAHERFGIAVAATLVASVIVVDILRWGLGVSVVGWSNFILVWLAAHQLGILWRGGTLTARRWVAWALAGGGLAALAGLVVLGPYPVNMIGLDRGARTNTVPPSLALVALAIWQTGLALLLRDAANRWLERPRVWVAVVAANGVIMTVYLWHLTALVFAALLVYPTGLFPQPEPATAGWWALRPPWVVACAVLLVPLVALFHRAERPTDPPPPAPSGWAGATASLIGTAGTCAGLTILALQGFPVPGARVALPLAALALLGAGIVLLRPLGSRITSRSSA